MKETLARAERNEIQEKQCEEKEKAERRKMRSAIGFFYKVAGLKVAGRISLCYVGTYCGEAY